MMTEKEIRELEAAVHACLNGPPTGRDPLSNEPVWDLQEAPRYALASSGEAMRLIENGFGNGWHVIGLNKSMTGWICLVSSGDNAQLACGNTPCIAICRGVLKAYGVDTIMPEVKL